MNGSAWHVSPGRYEKLVDLYPDNEDYKLYYAQSLYKVRAEEGGGAWSCTVLLAGGYIETTKAAVKVEGHNTAASHCTA